MELFFTYLIKFITFFVTSFVYIVNLFVSFFFGLFRFIELYVVNKFLLNVFGFLYKTFVKKAVWGLYYLIVGFSINLLVFPFVLVDNLLNVLTLVGSHFLNFLFFTLKMFFNFFLNFFSEYLSVFLLPEFLILFSSILSLLIFIKTKFSYTNDRFFNELAVAFGKSNVERISVGSYEYSVLIRFHNAKKRLTALFYS
jgi:hypothetical protein